MVKRVMILGLSVVVLGKLAGIDMPERKGIDGEPVEVHIVNNNNHKIEVHHERKDACDCTPFFGVQFKECMNYVSRACFAKNIQALDNRTCKKYVTDLSMQEVEELRASFTPEEWTTLSNECPEFAHYVQARFDEKKKRDEQNTKELKRLCGVGLLALFLFAGK